MADIQIGKSYRIYGKMGDMKRMKPVSGGDFVTTLIRAEVFVINTQEQKEKFERELNFLKDQGEFEAREV